MSFDDVRKALAAGREPALLCATCPWDRNCISPPTRTAQDVEQEMERAAAQDERRAAAARARGEHGAPPVAMLVTALAFAGADVRSDVCPVLAARLRASTGRTIVDEVKRMMQGWDDNA